MALESLETKRGAEQVRVRLVGRMVDLGFPWDASTLSKFLRGRRGATLDECLALARFVNVPIFDLVLVDQSSEAIRADAQDAWEGMTRGLERLGEMLVVIATHRARFVNDSAVLIDRARAVGSDAGALFVPELFESWWELEALITEDFHNDFTREWAATFYDTQAVHDAASQSRTVGEQARYNEQRSRELSAERDKLIEVIDAL